MGDLLEMAHLSSEVYPRPYALGSRLKLLKRAPLAAGGKEGEKMLYPKKSLNEFSIEELDRELVARGAEIPGERRFDFTGRPGIEERDDIMTQVKELYDNAPPRNKDLCHVSTWDLAKALMEMTGRKIKDPIRGIWGDDERIDYYQIKNPKIKRNAESVAAICFADNLQESNNGFYELEVRNYGTSYNLCECEPFRDQPIGAGRICTGFLTTEDTIATAGHCINEKNINKARFVFGYRMTGLCTPVTNIPKKDVYKGKEIIKRAYDRGKKLDWTLIKLDRKVGDRPAVLLSKNDVSRDLPVYVLGHPCGLPLKCGTGANVRDTDKTFFAANLDIYMGNSGSPVFDGNNHEVVGIVVHCDTKDFRYVGNGWLSVIYPNRDIYSKGPQCTRVSEFIGYCQKTE
jgi:hypothetical protein